MTLTIDLPDEKQQALAAKAHAAGLPVERYARQLIERDLGASTSEEDDRPIWDVILDHTRTVPPDAFEKLPEDGATQIDHYLYGHPKR